MTMINPNGTGTLVAEDLSSNVDELRGQVIAARLQVENLSTALTERDRQISILTTDVQNANNLANRRAIELAGFKEQVVKVAVDYAKRNDWCSTVREALNDLGLQWPNARMTFRVTRSWNITATLADRDKTYDEVTTRFIRDSLTIGDLELDSDWDEVEIEDTTTDITDLDEVDE